MPYSHFVFDAYGTLFDVHSAVSKFASEVGPDADRVSEIWRNKQLEYSWTRSAMGKYIDFWEITQEALDFALGAVPTANKAVRADLVSAYLTLDYYDEVKSVLSHLKDNGAKTAILSNGSPHMLESAVKNAKLSYFLDDVFSVDALRIFKTDPSTYNLVTSAWDVKGSQVCFLSSNRWDLAGAKAFGFSPYWINRTSQPDEYGDLEPVAAFENLDPVKGLLA